MSKQPSPERRVALAQSVRLETRGSGMPRLVGHAAVFNSPTTIAGAFREQVAPCAFTRALREGQDVRALVDHEPGKILGRTKANTLTLYEDGHGLVADIQLPDTSAGRDVVQSVGRGDLSGMSFAFTVAPGGETWTPGNVELDLQTLVDVDLSDVSVVTYPAYGDTDIAVAMRSHDRWQRERKPGLAENDRLRLAIARARLL